MADVRKLANGRWEARARSGGRDSRRLARTFDRKGDAERWAVEMRRRQRLGELVESDAGTQRLDEFIEVYWAMHVIPNLEVTTRNNYAHVWHKHIHPYLGHYRLNEITPKVVNRYRAELLARRVGSNTVRRALVVLQAILSLAITEEELVTNPVQRIRKPSQSPLREHVPIPGADARAHARRARAARPGAAYRPRLRRTAPAGGTRAALRGPR